MSKVEQLTNLEKECLACKRCPIGGCMIDGHLSNVFSNMCFKSKVMVVGQNPGRTEIEIGRPFVGPSGEFFDGVIESVLEIRRSKVYISNVVRCYTPNNRGVFKSEIENCRPFLDREIEIVSPKIIITLGNFALKQITGMTGITKHHGRVIFSPRYSIPVLPLFHPSPINMNKEKNRVQFMKDIKIAKEYIK